MSGFKFFSPLRTPHLKKQGESDDSVNKPDKELKQKNMGQTKNKKHDSAKKSISKKNLDTDGKQKTIRGGTIKKLLRKKSESDNESGSDAPHLSTSEEELGGSETESQLDRSLSQLADNLRARLHHSGSDDSEIIPVVDSQELRRSPRRTGSGSLSNPSSPTKKIRSPTTATRAIHLSPSPKKKLREVRKPMHELSESAESDESGGEEVHYKVPKLRNPPPADYEPVDFNEYKPLISAEETMSDDLELILITVPFGFDIHDLDNKPLQIDGDGLIKKDKDGVSWKSHARKLTNDDKIHEYTPLLPSKKTGQLAPVKPFSRQVTFTASYDIPELPDPVTPPEPSFEIPEGLKYRNKPFGCLEENDKVESPEKTTKRSHLRKKTEHDDKTMSPEHGKKRRHQSDSEQQHVDEREKKKKKKSKHARKNTK